MIPCKKNVNKRQLLTIIFIGYYHNMQTLRTISKNEFNDIYVNSRQMSDLIPFLSLPSIKVYLRTGKFPFDVKKLAGRYYARRTDVTQYVNDKLK